MVNALGRCRWRVLNPPNCCFAWHPHCLGSFSHPWISIPPPPLELVPPLPPLLACRAWNVDGAVIVALVVDGGTTPQALLRRPAYLSWPALASVGVMAEEKKVCVPMALDGSHNLRWTDEVELMGEGGRVARSEETTSPMMDLLTQHHSCCG